MAFFGHVHNYERTCPVYQEECKAMPTMDENGISTYDNSNYSAPVHAVMGMAGFTLDKFKTDDVSRSLSFPIMYICMPLYVVARWAFKLNVLWFLGQVDCWSLRRISNFGYVRGHATKEEINFEVSLLKFNIQTQTRCIYWG